MATAVAATAVDASRAGQYVVLYTTEKGKVGHEFIEKPSLAEVIKEVEPKHAKGTRIDIVERGNIMRPRWTKLSDGTVIEH